MNARFVCLICLTCLLTGDVMAQQVVQQVANEPELLVRSFRLEWALPSELAEELAALSEDAVIVPQDRNRQLIIRAAAETLAELEELIHISDVEPQRQIGALELASDDSESMADATQRLWNTIEGINKRNEELAAKARRDAAASSATVSNTELEASVAKEFDLQLSVQLSELELLRNRLTLVETRIARRKSLRKQIIRKRVQNLLSDQSPSPKATTTVAQKPQAVADVTSRGPQPQVPTAGVYSGNELILASPDAYRQRIQHARVVLESLRSLPDRGRIETREFGTITIEERGKLAAAEFQAAVRECTTQIQLLKLELDQALSEVELAERRVAQFMRLIKAGYASTEELPTEEIKVKRARLRADKARALLDLYSDILSESKDSSDAGNGGRADAPSGTGASAPKKTPEELGKPAESQSREPAASSAESPDVNLSEYTRSGLTAGTVYLQRTRVGADKQSKLINAYGTIVHFRGRSYVVASDRMAADNVVLKDDTLTATSLRQNNSFPAQILAKDDDLKLCVLARVGNGGELSPNERSLQIPKQQPLIGSPIYSLKLPVRFQYSKPGPEIINGRMTAMFGIPGQESELIETNLTPQTLDGVPIVALLPNGDCHLAGIVTTALHDDDMAVAVPIKSLRQLLEKARLHDPYVFLTAEEQNSVVARTDLKLEE